MITLEERRRVRVATEALRESAMLARSAEALAAAARRSLERLDGEVVTELEPEVVAEEEPAAVWLPGVRLPERPSAAVHAAVAGVEGLLRRWDAGATGPGVRLLAHHLVGTGWELEPERGRDGRVKPVEDQRYVRASLAGRSGTARLFVRRRVVHGAVAAHAEFLSGLSGAERRAGWVGFSVHPRDLGATVAAVDAYADWVR